VPQEYRMPEFQEGGPSVIVDNVFFKYETVNVHPCLKLY
jgi:hypothetical protein